MFRSNVSRPKLHHHVPVFYQEGFCRDGRLWVFDRVTGKYRHDQPKNVGAKTHDYSTTDADGRKNPKVEELLGQIEDAAKPIFAKLRGGLPLTQEDRENFAYYLGFFFVRGPRFQRMLDEMSTVLVKKLTRFETPQTFRATFDEMQETTGEDTSKIDVDAVYAFARSEQYSVRLNREYGLKAMATQAVELQNYFRQMEWLVAHADEHTAFLTTDNPMVVLPAPADRTLGPSRQGVITPGAIKVFPVAADTCLMLLDRGDRVIHQRFDANMVREVNIDVVRRCERLVLGRDEAHVRSIVSKTRVDRSPASPIFDADVPTG